MQVSVETTSPIGRRLTIQIPHQQVQTEVAQKLEKEMKHRRMDGFRAGKVPKTVIQKKFGAEIRHKAIGALIESTLPTALKQESLEPVGRPEIEEIINFDKEHEDLKFIVRFEIYPDVQVPNLSKVQVERQMCEVSEADVDKALLQVQEQFGTWNPVEEAAKMKDRCVIDYTSTVEGKPFDHSEQQDVSIELGSNRFIEGFEEGLVGAKAGDHRHLELKFPSDWRMETLAGKTVHFEVTVKEVARRELAKCDADLAKHIQAIGEDEAAIRQKIRTDLEERIAYITKERIKEQLLTEVLKLCEYELPKVLVHHEMSLMHEDLHRRMGDKAKTTCEHHGLEADAERRVRLSLLLREIVRLEKLIVREDKVKEHISNISRAYGNAEFIERMYYESEELLQQVQNSVLVDQAIDWMLSQAKVKETKVPVQEVLPA